MQLSENFTLEEFTTSQTALSKRIRNIPGPREIANLNKLCSQILQPIRNRIDMAIHVTSGFRCPVLNKAIGGENTSQHLTGEAADIVCYDNKLLWKVIIEMIRRKEIVVGQLINEKNLSWIHISLPNPSHTNQILSL